MNGKVWKRLQTKLIRVLMSFFPILGLLIGTDCVTRGLIKCIYLLHQKIEKNSIFFRKHTKVFAHTCLLFPMTIPHFILLIHIVNQKKEATYRFHFISTLFSVSGTFGGRFEKKLLRDLMVDYDNLERPVVNESHPLLVTFGITLQQIIDVES